MESMFWRVVTSLGVPGLALGVFYMITLNLELASAPPEWVGPLIFVTLCFAAGITFYALSLGNTDNIFNRFSEDIPSDRRDALIRTWNGTLKQKAREDTKVEINLKIEGKKILGEMVCIYTDIGEQKFDVSGLFHSGRFLRLDYANKDKSKVHFGTCYFELAADAKELEGSCVGFGVVAGEIVTANIMLRR